jgi:hypothetical protein
VVVGLLGGDDGWDTAYDYLAVFHAGYDGSGAGGEHVEDVVERALEMVGNVFGVVWDEVSWHVLAVVAAIGAGTGCSFKS